MRAHQIVHRLRITVLLGSAIGSFIACTDPPDLAGTRWQELSSKDLPYYLYDDEPVFLTIDPSRITLTSPPSLSEHTVRTSLGAIGLAGTQLQRSTVQRDTFHLVLPARTSIDGAVAVVSSLRRDRTFDFVANAYRDRGTGGEITLHNRLVVHLQDGAGPDAIEQLNRELGTQLLLGPLGGAPEYVVAYPRGVDPLAFALMVAERPEVAWVDPDKTSDRELAAIPSDPFFANQFYARSATTRNGVRVDTNVEWAWDLSLGAWAPSAGPFTVAVIDDGVQAAHPDLESSFVLGFDAFNNTWTGFGCTSCPTNPGGGFSHGTAVSGIIKAQHNNGMGLAGLAPAVKLLPIQIFKGASVASDSQIALGIDAAWQNSAQVISNSWGGGSPSNAITAAVNRATSQGRGGRGAVVVFAAGNTSARSRGIVGSVQYPARLPNVLAVGAINRNGDLTDYTPEGPELDVVAPSGHFTGLCVGEVVTVDLVGAPGCNDGPLGNLDYSSTFSGTSAAAPQVSSVAAMVISRSPTLTEAQVRSAITANADPWGTVTQFGAGKLNAYRALVGRTRVSISGPSFPSSPGVYQYAASATGGVGGYSYQWSISYNNGPFSGICLNSASCDLGIDSTGETISLQVVVTNGPDQQRATTTKFIVEPGACTAGFDLADGPRLPVPCDSLP